MSALSFLSISTTKLYRSPKLMTAYRAHRREVTCLGTTITRTIPTLDARITTTADDMDEAFL